MEEDWGSGKKNEHHDCPQVNEIVNDRNGGHGHGHAHESVYVSPNIDRHIHAHDLWDSGEAPANDRQENGTVSAHRCANDHDYIHEHVAQMQQSRQVHANAQHANRHCQRQKMNAMVSDYVNGNDRPEIYSSLPTFTRNRG